MWEFLFGVLVGLFVYKWWTFPRAKSVVPGLNKDVFLDHKEDVELYYNTLSSCSQKVRACLAEAGVKFRGIHKLLPSSGSFETKTVEYLRINPAGTVPVLVHKGHPIYESHEQIKYIEKNLLPEGVSLSPKDPEKAAEMLSLIDDSSMVMTDEATSDPSAFFRRRFGNCLGPMTFPMFCAKTTLYFDLTSAVQYTGMIPFVSDMKMIIMTIAFYIYGPEAFRKLSVLGKMACLVHDAIDYHLQQLEKTLKKSNGPYIFGEEYTLADIGYVPIFQRMEYARWWPQFQTKYPLVIKYWKAIQARPGYVASKPDKEMEHTLTSCGRLIDDWKKNNPIVKSIYNGKSF